MFCCQDFEEKGNNTFAASSPNKFPLSIADFKQVKFEFQKERKNEEFDRKEFPFAKQMLLSKKKESIRTPSIPKQKTFFSIHSKINNFTVEDGKDKKKEDKGGGLGGGRRAGRREEKVGRRAVDGGKSDEEEGRERFEKEEEFREEVEDKMEKGRKGKKKCLSMHVFGREKLSELAASILFHKT